MWYDGTRVGKWIFCYNFFMLYLFNSGNILPVIYMFTPGYRSGWMLFFAIFSYLGPFVFLFYRAFFSDKAKNGNWSTGFKWTHFVIHITNTSEFMFKEEETGKDEEILGLPAP